MSPVESLNNTMGAAYIGVSVAGFLLGLSCLQAYIYFSEQNDNRTIRSLVGLVVLFDFVHQALISHTVYYYLILNYANPSALSLAVWSLLAEVLFNGFTAFCVQSFLTWRIWRLSNSNFWVTGIVVSLVLAEFGCVVAFGIIAFVYLLHYYEYLSNHLLSLVRVSTFVELAADLKELSVTVNALAAAGDVLIAVYTNSLLATLNARNKIRNAGDNVQTTSGQNFSFSFKSFTKPSSFVSYSSKKLPGEISIQIDTTRERRAQDYSSRHTLSKQEEEYELGNSSTGNLSHGDIESTATIPTLANDAHFDAV
ncbi:hypothetical protein EV368DRAFT_78979 [Lentinula lateritia]|nr:hypothetical protein EV368DRAFT_78979 [Lentinula lateritia]